LALNLYEELGISDDFHGQWDMRRFVTHLAEHLVDMTHQREPTDPRRPNSRARNNTVRPDFFRALKIQNRRQYELFLDVLDDMSGHRFVHTQESLGVGNSDQTGLDRHKALLWQQHYTALAELMDHDGQVVFPNVTADEVNEVLGAFRDGGMRWFVKTLRSGHFYVAEYIERMWSWTGFEFPSDPGDVLDMEFFEDLYTKPRSRTAKTAQAASYRPLYDPQGRIDTDMFSYVQCEAVGCVAPGTALCADCKETIYCSEDCADAHFDAHSEDCTSNQH